MHDSWNGNERRNGASPKTPTLTDAQIGEAINKLQNVPSGEIFKSIGGVLAAHHAGLSLLSEISSLHSRRIDELRATVRPGPVEGWCEWGHPIHRRGDGKFRKFFSACCAIARPIKIFFRKK